MISWMYLVLEQVGECTENPFEGNPNDVPMAQICRKIGRELMGMLGKKGDGQDPPAEYFLAFIVEPAGTQLFYASRARLMPLSKTNTVNWRQIR